MSQSSVLSENKIVTRTTATNKGSKCPLCFVGFHISSQFSACMSLDTGFWGLYTEDDVEDEDDKDVYVYWCTLVLHPTSSPVKVQNSN